MITILTDENFDKEISGAKKLVLVDFFATWCEPCKMLAPILEKVADDLKDQIMLMKADLDEAPNTAGKFGVEKIPTIMLFKNGKPVSGFVGLAPESAIKEWIENTFKNDMIEGFDNYAKSAGIKLNPDKKAVERVVTGLVANEKKYGKQICPCRRVSGDEAEDAKKICPCAFHKDEIAKDGHCLCNLFVK